MKQLFLRPNCCNVTNHPDLTSVQLFDPLTPGLTDSSREVWRQNLYQRRAGLNKARPINIAFHAEGSSRVGRLACAAELEESGLAVLVGSEDVTKAAAGALPDTFEVVDEVDSMPEYVRGFRCQNQIEQGEPLCGKLKWNDTICEKRLYKTSWHPGWKVHALHGNLIAFFLFEILDDAIKIIEESTLPESELYSQLQTSEDADYKRFFESPVPDTLVEAIPESERGLVDLNLFVKGQTFCHTARLPAEIRHLGRLTSSTKTGFIDYYKGISLSSAQTSMTVRDGVMPLTYSEYERDDCPIPTHLDYKDYFLAQSNEKLTVPSDLEISYYGKGQPLQGYVFICYPACHWDHCPPGELRREQFFEGGFNILVNGAAATNLTEFRTLCDMLKHDAGYQFPLSAEGKIELSVQISETAPPNAFVRLSTVIVW
jgi:hypothetical protein